MLNTLSELFSRLTAPPGAESAADHAHTVQLAAAVLIAEVMRAQPGVSPAEDLAGRTIDTLTFHAVTPRSGVFVLGLVEVTLAGCLWLFSGNRWILGALGAHLGATFLPFLVHPGLAFGGVPGRLTATAQAIVLNLVLLAAVWALVQYHQLWPLRQQPDGGNERHGRWRARPDQD